MSRKNSGVNGVEPEKTDLTALNHKKAVLTTSSRKKAALTLFNWKNSSFNGVELEKRLF